MDIARLMLAIEMALEQELGEVPRFAITFEAPNPANDQDNCRFASNCYPDEAAPLLEEATKKIRKFAEEGSGLAHVDVHVVETPETKQ